MTHEKNMAQKIGKVPREYIAIITAEQRHNSSTTVKTIKQVMKQHYWITRNFDDSDDEEENGSEGTSKDGEGAMAGLKTEMKMGNKFSEQEGNHQGQPNPSQVQF